MKRLSILIGIGTAMLTFAAVLSQKAIASDQSQTAYEIVVIGNQAFGGLIVNGESQTAIRRLVSRTRLYPFAAATNLCVAHTVLERFDEAEPFCNQAVELTERATLPRPRHWAGRTQVASNGALAYSNRGVLRVLRGDRAGAEEDFRAAIELKNDMRAPAHNFARLNMETTDPVAVRISQ